MNNVVFDVLDSAVSGVGGAGVLAGVRGLRIKPQIKDLSATIAQAVSTLSAKIDAQSQELRAEIHHLDDKIDAVAARMDVGFAGLNARFVAFGDRLGRLEHEVAGHEGRLVVLEARLA